MRTCFFLFTILLISISCTEKAKTQTPGAVLQQAIDKLENWETLSFETVTTNPSVLKEPQHTAYKLKRVSYEPHLQLFFYKEMNGITRIYYKLASLVVVEDNKKKITTFDYVNDRSIPDYLEAFTGDGDNLANIGLLLKSFQGEIITEGNEEVEGKDTYVYSFKNYKAWLDVETALPIKFQIDNNFPEPNIMLFKNVVFNEDLTDKVFTHEENEDYVSSVFGIKAEPLLDTMAKDWTLLDLDGNEVSLSDFKGENMFIEAWVSSCHHCIASIPKVKKIANDFEGKVKVVTVNFDYDLEETTEAVQRHSIDYLVLQGTSRFDKDYDIRSFPAYYVIDKTGKIIFTGTGAIDGEKEQALFKVLNGLR